MDHVLDWLKARAVEPTTWLGVGALVAAIIHGSLDTTTLINAIAGIAGITISEKGKA